ncbi:hypothetical protein ABT112_08115 [Streptomyces sp. NPDC002055]|uniref:hypothetical protein n=1 Tax=Streptomyces sp. NPDC002055 TaxID=3154534 RepID=UPI0033275DD4
MTTRTPGTSTQPLGLGHFEHPLLGRLVVDHAHGDRVGVLRAIAPDVDNRDAEPELKVPDTPPMAWLAPAGGGLEWITDPDEIEAVTEPGGPTSAAGEGEAR